jgi:hypothetical protein
MKSTTTQSKMGVYHRCVPGVVDRIEVLGGFTELIGARVLGNYKNKLLEDNNYDCGLYKVKK